MTLIDSLVPFFLLGQHLLPPPSRRTVTLPPQYVNFVAGPNIRGTLTILWNCLSIIILCTWNIQHLNIPAQRETLSDEKTFTTKWFANKRQTLWWKIVNVWTQLKWMLFTVLIPEYIMGKAQSDRLAATRVRDKMNANIGEDRQPFELIHGCFANMGGCYLDFSHLFPIRPTISDTRQSHWDKSLRDANKISDIPNPATSMEDVIKAIDKSGGIADVQTKVNLQRLMQNCWALNGFQLVRAQTTTFVPYL